MSIFLAVTGGEALYADMGHFGAGPIRRGWFSLVFPALALNYLGQGALLMHSPESAHSPFFQMAPGWATLPLVLLATAATVIASQALITGTYSLTLSAVQLGYLPRLSIRHTSEHARGQIYIPLVNWLLMLACLTLVVAFCTSSNLAAAYGVAVTMTMLITTILFYFAARHLWKWSLLKTLPLCLEFGSIELAFLSANLVKFFDGGLVPARRRRGHLHRHDHLGHRSQARACLHGTQRHFAGDAYSKSRERKSHPSARHGHFHGQHQRTHAHRTAAQPQTLPGHPSACHLHDADHRRRALGAAKPSRRGRKARR